MKIKVNSGNSPETISEHEKTIMGAAGSLPKQEHQELEIDINRDLPTVVNSEFEQELAEELKLKIDNEIAEEAFLISQRHDFGHGDEAADWADRVQAEINAQSNLRTHYYDRRNLGNDDRHHEAAKDRRHH